MTPWRPHENHWKPNSFLPWLFVTQVGHTHRLDQFGGFGGPQFISHTKIIRGACIILNPTYPKNHTHWWSCRQIYAYIYRGCMQMVRGLSSPLYPILSPRLWRFFDWSGRRFRAKHELEDTGLPDMSPQIYLELEWAWESLEVLWTGRLTNHVDSRWFQLCRYVMICDDMCTLHKKDPICVSYYQPWVGLEIYCEMAASIYPRHPKAVAKSVDAAARPVGPGAEFWVGSMMANRGRSSCGIYPFSNEGLIFWLVVWNIFLWLSIQLGISSSQLTNSIIFQRGRSTTNQLCLFHFLPWTKPNVSPITKHPNIDQPHFQLL